MVPDCLDYFIRSLFLSVILIVKWIINLVRHIVYEVLEWTGVLKRISQIKERTVLTLGLIHDFFVEWLKLTTIGAFVIMIPFLGYLAWDFVTSEVSLARRMLLGLMQWMSDNLGLYLLLLGILAYLTYI